MTFSLPPRPVLTWQQIAGAAKSFADRHNLAARDFPLDVEEVVEFDLGMDLRVVSGLLEECGSPAQIGPGEDRPVIAVDSDQYRHQTSFYRFSLAHEVGHFALHHEWLKQVWRLIDSIEAWKQVVAARSESDYEWVEGQADEFASYLLAPEQVFEPFLNEQLARLVNLEPSLRSEDILPYLANPVGVQFGMSSSAAQARIRKSPQWRQFAEKTDG